MGSEYFINSQELEDKVRNLLPSQGGAGAGFDLSASTQIIPIIDLTESAEGSNVREDLQTSLSHGSITSHAITNATTTIISNTGYFRIFGCSTLRNATSALVQNWSVSDGSTTKIIWGCNTVGIAAGTVAIPTQTYDFIVFLEAGHSIIGTAANGGNLIGSSRQIADISGSLVNP